MTQAQAPPQAWVIFGEEDRKDETIHLENRLVVMPGGVLRLDNVTLLMEEGGSILVAAGGTMHVDESRLMRHDRTTHWPFDAFGRVEMTDSTLSGSHGLNLSYAGTQGSTITESRLVDNGYAIFVLRRAELEFRDNHVEGNGAGIRVRDASAVIHDNVFVGNSWFAIELVSSLAGSRTFGPVVADVKENVIAHGTAGIDVQEGNDASLSIRENLITNTSAGIRFYEGGDLVPHAQLSENSVVGNHVAAYNQPRGGIREAVSDLLGYPVDLAGNWLGPEGATSDPAAPNRLEGPFQTDGLLERDPVPRLWDRLALVEESLEKQDEG